MANLATTVARENLLSLGTCLGKMTKTGKFKLHITALPILGMPSIQSSDGLLEWHAK